MALIEKIQPGAEQPIRYQLKSPATLELIGAYEVPDQKQIAQAVARARKAQAPWAKLGFEGRAQHLEKLRNAILENMDDVMKRIIQETGKAELEALSEVVAALDALQYYPKYAGKILKEKSRTPHLFRPFKKLVTTYHPRGVVAIITPWNFPFSMGMNPTAQALMAGNAVILKPSELTPFASIYMEELARVAGLPEGVFQVLAGDGITGASLIESGIDKVHFTGSVATGRRVGELCGRLLIPCTLELGGKDAAIVCADADLTRAVAGVVNSTFVNTGQACAATERVYVHESIAEQFTAQVVEQVKALKQHSGKEDKDIACMISEAQSRIVEQQVAEAVKQGAVLKTGGKRKAGEIGLFYEPTVLTNVTHNMTVMTEETFGPVLPIMTFKTIDEAIALANDNQYGLSASSWCGNKDEGFKIAKQLQTGCASVNDFGGLVYGAAEGSFGGRKNSGVGYVNGELGLKSFCQIQHILIHKFGPALEQHWFPLTSDKVNTIKKFARFLFGSSIGRWLT